MAKIYKLFLPDQWADFSRAGLFLGAPVDLADGYIHLSAKDQAIETANKHFAAHSEIVLARIETQSFDATLTQALKWEVSRGGAKFPHLYAPLPFSAIEAYWSVEKGDDGFAFPKDW